MMVRISGEAMLMIDGSELSNSPEKYDGGSIGAQDAFNSLRTTKARKAGKGWTYEVETSEAGARCIEDYCRTVGETFTGEPDPETRATGRALLKVADNIVKLLNRTIVNPRTGNIRARYPRETTTNAQEAQK
jgi:hypothetical protein